MAWPHFLLLSCGGKILRDLRLQFRKLCRKTLGPRRLRLDLFCQMVLQAPEFGLLGEHLVLFGFTCGFVVGNVRFKDSRKSARNGGGKASQESGTC